MIDVDSDPNLTDSILEQLLEIALDTESIVHILYSLIEFSRTAEIYTYKEDPEAYLESVIENDYLAVDKENRIEKINC